MKVYCKNCKWFFSTEASVEVDFIRGFTKTNLPIKAPSNILKSEWGTIPMCQHEECFKFKKNKPSPERPIAKFKKIRVKGQGQFNINNNCKHYIRKWWKFWIKQPKLKGKIERLKAWPLPNISSSEIPKCPKCKTPHRRKR